MTRSTAHRSLSWIALLFTLFLITPASARAQTPNVSGTVSDESGAVLVGARITLVDAKGAVVRTVVTDAAGAFAVVIAPGTFTVRSEASYFVPASQSLVVPETGAAPPLRILLKAGGFTESVGVTASRAPTRVTETPQKMEIVDAIDVERTVALEATDLLKKNAGVDVIQYNGTLSGIGIRGFRPQVSGINKRYLLLIDGRPSGITNMATLLLDNVERIEVLKGAASAVYGSSAMGGVVNVITRQSTGRVGGQLRLGGGSFGTSDVAGRAGGRAGERLDFDVSGRALDQRGDIRMGNGVEREATSYQTYSGAGRLGAGLGAGWRIEGRSEFYRGLDLESPPDLASGNLGQSSKDIERGSGDVRLSGLFRGHELLFAGFKAGEASHTSNVTTFSPADLPFLPYLSFESDLDWAGAQVRDVFNWNAANRLVIGVDYEKVTSISRSFSRTGDAVAPFSADSNKRTIGAYFENTLRLRGNDTIVVIGGRFDRITTATLETPLKTNFVPSESTFDVFNPSFGIKQAIGGGVRAHFAAGRAFIPAEAIQLTGFTTSIVGGRTQISQGNPGLKPERSTSYDGGLEWTGARSRVDVTAFWTRVKDRFISNVVVSNPPPPDPIIVTVQNGLDAHISGLDFDAAYRVSSAVTLSSNATHFFERKERLASGAEQDILNVAKDTIRVGVDFDIARIAARFGARYVHGRKDNDFNLPGFPIVDYDDFTVIDATFTYRLGGPHAVMFAVNNVFDAYYYEKLGYPLQGASFKLWYTVGFGR